MLSVKRLLEMEPFKNVTVIAGKNGLDHEIKSVNVMEVPDIFPYIDEQGLLFTTLFPIYDDEVALNQFIERLSEKRLAGVAIKLGRYLPEVPEYMIEQAEKHHFPILILPSDANLSTLTNYILTELLDKKTALLEFRETIASRLHHFLLEGSDMSQFVKALSELSETPIIILDAHLQIEASSVLTDELLLHEKGLNVLLNEEDKKHEIVAECLGKTYTQNNVLFESIMAGNKLFGYLLVLKADFNSDDTLNIIVEQAIILLAYLMQTKAAIQQKERNYLDSFLRDILNARYQSQSEIIDKAKVFKWHLHFPNVILVIRSSETNTANRISTYTKVLDSEKIEQAVSHVFDIPLTNCKVAYFEEELVVFISLAFETRLEEKLKKLGELIINTLSTMGTFSISVSEPIEQLQNVKDGYQHARLVHEIYRHNKASYIEFYQSLGLFKVFPLIKDREKMRMFIEEYIGDIIRYDQKKDMDLMHTLANLIKNNGNVQKTSEEMFIHYNSLRYRIQKLKDLGVDLSDGDKMIEVAVACQMYRYLQL